jgi:hypothetical protein
MTKQQVVAALAAAAMAVIPLAGVSPAAAATMAQARKHYKATRPFVVDKQTGAVRMPTQAEVDDVVATLTTLTTPPAGNQPEAMQPAGAVTADLPAGFGGVILAKPNGDGTYETRCVFTLDEGAEFLGLAEDVQ